MQACIAAQPGVGLLVHEEGTYNGKTQRLIQALQHHRFDAAFCGARRDEENG